MLESGSSYEDTVFKSLDMSGKSLKKCTFENVVFENCLFIESEWSQAHFTDCRFKNCNLSLVKLVGSRLQQISFEECKVVGLDFYRCEKFAHITFNKSVLQTCNFTELKLKGISFQGSKIREVHFTNTDLTEANFMDTDLMGTIFHHCNLSKADFKNAKNYLIDLQVNNVKKAKFSFPEAMNLLKFFDIEIT